MDRLPALIALALCACDTGADTSGASASRVNAVKGEARRVTTDELCDVRYPDERAPTFTLPALAGPTPPSSRRWRWVNVWATWCKPCLEELPRLERWVARRPDDLELVLISADTTDAAVAAFHSSRLADPDALPTWLTTLGLDAGSPIPIHVLVDPAGRTRCVRAGGVSDADLAAADALLGT